MSRSRPSLDVSGCLLDPAEFPPDQPFTWQSLFGTKRPVELEIGSGKGLFLASAGAARPDHEFLGIEISRKYARVAAERITVRGVTNVRIWPGDAKAFMASHVAEASLHAVHVYFPDPWWKKRHKKRRVFTGQLVDSIFRGLAPEGQLHVATDVEEYFEVIQSLIASEPRFIELPRPEARAPEHDLDYLTNFERKFRLEGRAIQRALYRKG